jgi:environmental stress-induced protein Ves
MSIRVHPARSRRASAWKNGKGVTREVAVYPPSSDLNNFAWRVSIAEVSEAGMFSVFHGVDRKLAILDGVLSLSIGGDAAMSLSPESEPVAFPGDIPCKAEIFGHPVRDLNVMARRDHFSSRLTMIEVAGPATIAVEAGKTLIVALHDLVIEMDPSAVRLGPLDAASFEGISERQDRRCNVKPGPTREAARFYVVDLFPVRGS